MTLYRELEDYGGHCLECDLSLRMDEEYSQHYGD